MLLIDGVKYELRTPSSEDELENMVKEHAQDIFGENSIYLDKKQKLKSLAGVGSIPDGLVIMFGNVPEWHIVEVELSSHQLYDHIVNQVGRFINGVKNTVTQKKIIEAIYHHIQENKQRKAEFEEAIGSGEIYKLLTDVISKSPVLTIIIEKRTRELDEALDLLRYSPIKIVEFQTFTRKGTEGLAVHAHLFEPLHKRVITPEPKISSVTPPVSPENSFEVTMQPSYIESRCVYIPAAKKHLFPTSNTTLELHTDTGVIETNFSIDSFGRWLSKGLAPWFSHSKLQVGDNVRITVIEPMKKYSLEIVKQ